MGNGRRGRLRRRRSIPVRPRPYPAWPDLHHRSERGRLHRPAGGVTVVCLRGGGRSIIDPEKWRRSAPRWQRAHAAELAGPAGPVRADQIKRPVLLIHGSDDDVAALADVAALTRTLAARGIPHRLLVVDARHQLSAQQTAAQALQAETAFYGECLEG